MPRDDTSSFNLSNKIDIDGTLIALFLPSILMAAAVLPGGLLLVYTAGMASSVPGGSTVNFYYTMLIYCPIMCTLGLATTMVGAGRIVAKEFARPDSKGEDSEEKRSSEEPQPSTASPQPSTTSPLKRHSLKKAGTGVLAVSKLVGVTKSKKDAAKRDENKHQLAIKAVRQVTKFEVLQWMLVFAFVSFTLMVGNFSLPTRPLWDEPMRPYLIGYAFVGALAIVLLMFTVRNLKLAMVKREGKKTSEYCAALLGRIGITLLFQHLCFFWTAICGVNMMPAVQPLAFSIYTTTQQEMEPCSLLTESFYSLNCTRALDLYGGGLGPLGTQLACTGEPWGPYQTAFTACGAATSAIRMRNVGYAAVMININLLFYLILKECTRDMSEVALSKMARGQSDARTSTIFALSSVALVCVPIFFIYMLVSPLMLFKPDLVFILTLTTGFNGLCWMVIFTLLNLEFLVAMIRHRGEFDVFISYRVWCDAMLAEELYKALKKEARVYLDKVELKTGEGWEQGFVKGLGSSSVYVVLLTDRAVKGLMEADSSSECDNVFLEMRLARELHARGLDPKGDPFKVVPVFERIFQKTEFPETEITAVEIKLKQKLKELNLEPKTRTPAGVRDNVSFFLKLQGFVDQSIGDSFDATGDAKKKEVIKAIVSKVMPVVEEVRGKAGGSCAELCGKLNELRGKRKVSPAPANESDSAGGSVRPFSP